MVKKIIYLCTVCLIFTNCIDRNRPTIPVDTEEDKLPWISGKFAIGENKYVYFSKGDLQYLPSENKWRFAEKSTELINRDYVTKDDDNWIDTFMWATSGHKDENDENVTVFMPWERKGKVSYRVKDSLFVEQTFVDTYQSNKYYITYRYYLTFNFFGLGPSIKKAPSYDYTYYCSSTPYDLQYLQWRMMETRKANDFDFDRIYDWGNNKISNGGDKMWRTLTKKEWEYLIKHHKHCHVDYSQTSGVLIFPLDWEAPEGIPIDKFRTNGAGEVDVTTSSYNIDRLISSGAVFLPGDEYWTASTSNDIYTYERLNTFDHSNTVSYSSNYKVYEKYYNHDYFITFSTSAYSLKLSHYLGEILTFSIEKKERDKTCHVRLVCDAD